MRICPECDREIDDAPSGCPDCQEERAVVRCARCDTRFREARACPACGALRSPTACDTHPERQGIGECVVCGRALCPECDAAGSRVHLCGEHRGVRVTEGWAEVFTSTSEFEAQLVRDNLRAEGIEAQVYSQRDRIFSVDLGELSIVRLLVPVWSYQEAAESIGSRTHADGDVAFACPTCGEAAEPAARECPACGDSLA